MWVARLWLKDGRRKREKLNSAKKETGKRGGQDLLGARRNSEKL